MNRLLAAFAFVMFLGAPAFAANQQVVTETYKKDRPGDAFYGRSDGMYWHKDSKIPVLIGNGDGIQAIGPTYRDTFAYGDGLGLVCEAIPRPVYSKASGANAACTTTCAPSTCVFGFDNGAADAEALEDCASTDSDECTCQAMSADDVLVSCGANWEAPASAVSLIHFASGVTLAHVSLLQQDIGPDMDADGLDIAGDQTDDDGVELFGGMFGASGRPLVPNVDPAFKFCVEVNVEDLDGTDTLYVGFRDSAPPDVSHTATLIDTYNSYFAIGLDNTSGDWHIIEEDDGDTHTITDVTLDALVESEATEVCVLVSDTGVATATVEGASASDAPAYTFDAGEGVIPFVHLVHATAVADEVLLTLWEVSYQ